MSKHNAFIDSLAQDLAPGRRVAPAGMQALAWWLAATVYVVLVTLLLGPLRPGAVDQLLSEPRFFVETLSGLIGIGATAMAAFASSIPGRAVRPWALLAAVTLGIWLVSITAGVSLPTLSTGMLGKRPHCFSETLIYALPPMLLVLFLVRRAYPLKPVQTGLAAGLAAGLLPAWFMQMACMYETQHILMHHVLPGVLVVPLAAIVLHLWKRGTHKARD